MNKLNRITVVLLAGLILASSGCGPKKKTSATPVQPAAASPTLTLTATPSLTLANTLTATPTLTLTATPTQTATPTITWTPLPTKSPTPLPTNTPPFGITLPVLPICIPTGNSCNSVTQGIPGLGTCTITVCTDSCGNVTSETTGNCSG
jgi:hypothetical protein